MRLTFQFTFNFLKMLDDSIQNDASISPFEKISQFNFGTWIGICSCLAAIQTYRYSLSVYSTSTVLGRFNVRNHDCHQHLWRETSHAIQKGSTALARRPSDVPADISDHDTTPRSARFHESLHDLSTLSLDSLQACWRVQISVSFPRMQVPRLQSTAQ